MSAEILNMRVLLGGDDTLPRQRRDDASLVSAAKRGDRDAFSELHSRYIRPVYAILLSKVSPQDAEDLAQDVFVRALQKISTLHDDAAFGGWLLQMARNIAIDYIRAPKPTLSSTLQSTPHSQTPHVLNPTTAEQPPTLEAAEVLRALRQLPDSYCEPLIMRLIEGMTGPEIAQRTGLSEGTIRVNLHRGMHMLKAILAEHPHSQGEL